MSSPPSEPRRTNRGADLADPEGATGLTPRERDLTAEEYFASFDWEASRREEADLLPEELFATW